MKPPSSRAGTSSWMSEDHQVVVGTTELKPSLGAAAWTRRSTCSAWASVKENSTFLPTGRASTSFFLGWT